MLFGSDHEAEALDRMLAGEGEECYGGYGAARPEPRTSSEMKNFTKLVKKAPLEKSFRWIDQYGEAHCVKQMETQHLFFSLRMIWNHSAPIEMRIEPYKRYSINRSVEYITQAVKHIYAELQTRNDMKPYFIKCMKHMEACLEGHFNPKKKIRTRT